MIPALRRAALPVTIALSLLQAGCAELLPVAKNETQVPWSSYDDARQSLERIVPYQTRKAELMAAGLDPASNPAITVLTFSDILQRFAAGSSLRSEDLEPGIRQCLMAGKSCSGYSLSVNKINRDRVGNFWLDSLNFRREIHMTGFTFNALILMVDELVVYTLHGGKPSVHERELTRNPLGPLQTWGDTVPGLLTR